MGHIYPFKFINFTLLAKNDFDLTAIHHDAADRLASPFKCVQQAEGLLFDIRRRHVSTNRRLPFSTS
ncbi:hypothetical protein, partial [Pseudooceanicola nanhaiensis]|uniref:hypothetical protein n=1 Tax=Pseudooceanicola nanhaiensis TaxID=375761 RepID=UPI001CD43F8A